MLTLLIHELKYYMKNFHEVIYIYGFLLLMLLLFPMGLRGELQLLPELAPMMLWLGLVVTVSLGTRELFQREAMNGVLEGYLQLYEGAGRIVAVKWLVFYLAIVAPVGLLLPIILGLYGMAWDKLGGYGAMILSGGAALSMLAAMVACITAGLERGRAVGILVILPLSTPILIFGSAALHTPEGWSESGLLFMLAYSIFLLPILCLAGGSSLKASI